MLNTTHNLCWLISFHSVTWPGWIFYVTLYPFGWSGLSFLYIMFILHINIKQKTYQSCVYIYMYNVNMISFTLTYKLTICCIYVYIYIYIRHHISVPLFFVSLKLLAYCWIIIWMYLPTYALAQVVYPSPIPCPLYILPPNYVPSHLWRVLLRMQ